MKKIFIDAGHGGVNPGATYNGRKESEDVYRLGEAVAKRLSAVNGVEVRLSRKSGEDPEINSRAEAANKWGADFFISIHRNAFAPEKASGAEVWCYSKIEKGGVTYKKAEDILRSLCESTGFANRGVKLGAPSYTDFGVNRLTGMHSCLLEVGFIDSTADNRIFDSRFDVMADALAVSLCRAVGVEMKKAAIPGDMDGDGRVSVGDAQTILKASLGLEKLDDSLKSTADVDGDGRITVNDARLALKKAVDKEV